MFPSAPPVCSCVSIKDKDSHESNIRQKINFIQHLTFTFLENRRENERILTTDSKHPIHVIYSLFILVSKQNLSVSFSNISSLFFSEEANQNF